MRGLIYLPAGEESKLEVFKLLLDKKKQNQTKPIHKWLWNNQIFVLWSTCDLSVDLQQNIFEQVDILFLF